MKKAQMQQMFIYLSAIIVIGLLVLFGFRMINKLMGQQCEVQEQSLFVNIEKNIDRSTRYGSRTEAVIQKPCDYDKLCFVDTPTIKDGNTLNSPYTLMNLNADDSIEYNVYLIKNGKDPIVVPILFDERITVKDTQYVCINSTNGKFVFWLEGLGKNGVSIYTP